MHPPHPLLELPKYGSHSSQAHCLDSNMIYKFDRSEFVLVVDRADFHQNKNSSRVALYVHKTNNVQHYKLCFIIIIAPKNKKLA